MPTNKLFNVKVSPCFIELLTIAELALRLNYSRLFDVKIIS